MAVTENSPTTGRGELSIELQKTKKRWLVAGNTTSMPVDPAILSEIKLDFQRKIKRAHEDYNIPDDLIINFNQTPLAYICASNRTMDFQGAENVPIVGKGKKQQISGTFSGTKSGLFLPTRASARPPARPSHLQGKDKSSSSERNRFS